MGFLIVICVALPILALAAQRNDFKRMALIAVGLEAVKYLVFLTISPVRNEVFNFILVIALYVTMLPELMIGNELGPSTVWQWTARLCLGIVWNIAPAYLISLFLPERPSKESLVA